MGKKYELDLRTSENASRQYFKESSYYCKFQLRVSSFPYPNDLLMVKAERPIREGFFKGLL